MMTDRAAYTAGLRELADRLDANPDCPLPFVGASKHSPIDWVLDDREDVANVARLLGSATKGRNYDDSLMLTSRLHGLEVRVLTHGGVCERVEVGTTVETRTIEVCSRCDMELVALDGEQRCPRFTFFDDGKLHDRFFTPATRTVEVEVPRYETRCPESILAPVETYEGVGA